MKLSKYDKAWYVDGDGEVQEGYVASVAHYDVVYTTVDEAREAAAEIIRKQADDHAAQANALRERAERVLNGEPEA